MEFLVLSIVMRATKELRCEVGSEWFHVTNPTLQNP
jgi:hypothetical protein